MNYDAIIIGGGPAGTECALTLAKNKKRVALIEKQAIGGVCLNRGCVPSKSYLYLVEILENIKKAKRLGLKIEEPEILWEQVKKKKDMNVKMLSMGLTKSLKDNGVEVLEGKAEITGDHEVTINEKNITAENIVVATGTEPLFVEGIEAGENVISSTKILDLDKIPESLVIIGGGVIGVEMASVFSALGTEVTIIERSNTLLPNMDTDVTAQLKKSLQKKGCKILLETSVKTCKDKDDKAEVVYDDDTLLVDKALVVIGRKPSTDLKVVNDNLQTDKNNIYVIGDAAGKNLTAYGGEREGESVAKHILEKQEIKIDYDNIPITVFSHPEVASIGLTEEMAKEKGVEIEVGTSDYAANAKATIMGEREGMVKIVIDKKTQKILGVHIIGVHAVDLIHQAFIPVIKEFTVSEWKEVIWSHPVLSEVIKTALN